MRVISGINKGTKLDGYNIDGVRPTLDMVKESVFAIINSKIKNSISLDLFSGTGSIGIELLSNGSNKVYFVDSSITSINAINKNIEKTHNKDKSIIINKDYEEALKYFSNKIKFDIIYLDPPYGVIKITEVLKYIIKYDVLNDDGIIICEYENEEIDTTLELLREKKHGRTIIRIYKKV